MDLTPAERAAGFWQKSRSAIASAKVLCEAGDFEGAVNRAYYAAFDAISALFALDGKQFKRHSQVEQSVHRDLVKAGLWPAELGAAFSELLERREDADYGVDTQLTADRAVNLISLAEKIVAKVASLRPDLFR